MRDIFKVPESCVRVLHACKTRTYPSCQQGSCRGRVRRQRRRRQRRRRIRSALQAGTGADPLQFMGGSRSNHAGWPFLGREKQPAGRPAHDKHARIFRPPRQLIDLDGGTAVPSRPPHSHTQTPPRYSRAGLTPPDARERSAKAIRVVLAATASAEHKADIGLREVSHPVSAGRSARSRQISAPLSAASAAGSLPFGPTQPTPPAAAATTAPCLHVNNRERRPAQDGTGWRGGKGGSEPRRTCRAVSMHEHAMRARRTGRVPSRLRAKGERARGEGGWACTEITTQPSVPEAQRAGKPADRLLRRATVRRLRRGRSR
eukprot:364449-Chlamydomonas_euryale.AAC.1